MTRRPSSFFILFFEKTYPFLSLAWMDVCLHVFLCTTCMLADRDQKRMSDHLELGLQVPVIYHIGARIEPEPLIHLKRDTGRGTENVAYLKSV